MRQCDLQGLIPAIEFGCFVGAVGLVDALAGMISAFMEIIPYISESRDRAYIFPGVIIKLICQLQSTLGSMLSHV